MSGMPHPGDHATRERAASDFTTNLVVSAGAGTGKTTLLVERILTAIGSGRASLSAIAAITFTDKAAGELRHRLASGLRALGELARGAPTAAAPSAAKSAFSRLTASSRESLAAIAARVNQAEASLDRATVTTIHGLCSEILRAHPLASGLPPGFVADRGLAGRRIASLEWASFVEDELGPSGRRADLWERVLGSVSLEHLEEIGRVLAGGAISEAALGADHRAVDLRAVLGDEALRLADSIRAAIVATAGLTDAPREWLEQAERVLRVFAASGPAAARTVIESSQRLAGPVPDVHTRKVAESDANRLVAIAKSARPFVRSLTVFDERLEADLFAALLPFARRLRARQTRAGLVDFDGLLVRTRDLLRDDPDVRASLKRRFAMILVDEFQDTDPIQYEIVFFLAEQSGSHAMDAYETSLAPGSLFIVGDAKQSIYRFRGADFAAYRRAVGHVLGQGGVELSLASNFRSTPGVLGAINALFGAASPALWVASDYLPRYEAVAAERADDGVAAVEIWTTGAGPASTAPVRRRAEGVALAAEIGAMAKSGSEFRYDDVLVLFRGFTDLPPYLRALREAAIPFVVSGGRTFFERTEIVQAMAVLRAVADPEDPVALLAYRRSPAGGVPDTELFAHAVRGRGPFPALAAADSRLAALRLTVEQLPVDAAVRHVLNASGLITLSGLAFEAAQRVANLEKLSLAASELSRDGHRTFLETLDALEEGFEFDEEGDSPLADADHDAVRVMSIHKAKGLEARVVILADTAASRTSRGVRRFTARMTRVDRDEYVRVNGPTFRNGAAIAASLDDLRHEEAENVRLLYVALTRARDRLMVFGGGAGTAWSDALGAWTEGVTRRTVADSAATRRIELRPALGAADALARFDAAAALTRIDTSFRSPSDLGDADGPVPAIPGASEPELARAVGRIVHAKLAGIEIPDSGFGRDEAESVLRLFEASPLAARLATLDVLGREVPLLLGEDGLLWHGSIDLLYRDRDGTIVVADYKTDASDDGAIARHGGQLGVYARAVRRALPRARVRAELWMLRTGRVLEV